MVIFTSNRPLSRAENLKSVYDSYDGEKRFEQLGVSILSGDVQVTDELPIYPTLKKCIFIGHGMGACKTYGLDQPYPFFRRERSSMLTYCIASSKHMIPIVAKQCGISVSQVIPAGMPRTDAYFADREKNREHKRYLYAPTYRDGIWTPDWRRIERALPDGCELIVKPHMLTGGLLNRNYKNIREASSQEPTTPYLLDCDALITDYSSLMFDAMVIRTHVVLYANDRYRYLRDRGMYYPYPSAYSDSFAETEEELVEMLGRAEWTDKDEERKEFFTGSCDGHSVERVLEMIESLKRQEA